jgi:hypothetical protein
MAAIVLVGMLELETSPEEVDSASAAEAAELAVVEREATAEETAEAVLTLAAEEEAPVDADNDAEPEGAEEEVEMGEASVKLVAPDDIALALLMKAEASVADRPVAETAPLTPEALALCEEVVKKVQSKGRKKMNAP